MMLKKPEAPKEKGVTFREPAPPTKSKLPPVEGKGKEKMEEPSRPAKKQKLTPLSEQGQTRSVPKVVDRREVDIKHHLSLHGMAGSLGQGMAMDSLGKVTHSLNILGGEIGKRLKDDNTNNLCELRIYTVVVVCIYS